MQFFCMEMSIWSLGMNFLLSKFGKNSPTWSILVKYFFKCILKLIYHLVGEPNGYYSNIRYVVLSFDLKFLLKQSDHIFVEKSFSNVY